jgi:putative ABC transport system substrate-binding protein
MTAKRVRNDSARVLVASLVIATLLLSSTLPVVAQEKPLRIGVLALGPRRVPVLQCGPRDDAQKQAEARLETMPFYVLGLRDELERLKYVEDRPENAGKPGRRFALDIRMGNLEGVKRFAREFAQERVDVIVAVATAGVRAAQEATRDNPIPILFPGISDPVGDGFVQSLARPGGFITGVSHQQVQGSAKRVELFKEMVPELRRLMTIHRPDYGPAEKSMAEIRAAADKQKLVLVERHATSREEIRAVMAKLRPDAVDGIMIIPDSLIISNLDVILEMSLEQRIPTFGLQDFMADWGALGAYGPSAYQAGRRVALYVEKIVKGAKPGDLPVEPVDPTFVVNVKVGECLGVPVPLQVLQQADRVIR